MVIDKNNISHELLSTLDCYKMELDMVDIIMKFIFVFNQPVLSHFHFYKFKNHKIK